MSIATRLEQIAQDARYALRQIRGNPGFAGVALATLALGIGGTTAMFGAVDAVLLRPLPYADAGRLVMIWDDMSHMQSPKFVSTPPEWQEWRRQNTVFIDVAASQPGEAALSNAGEPEQLPARKVTGNFWTVLGARPLLGRVFTEDEDVRGAPLVVISHGLWQRRFGAARDAIGRVITLNDKAYEIVGVMPREFYFLPSREIDVWMPASFSPGMLRNWGWHDVDCVARLKPGVTLMQARKAMAALSLRVTADRVKPPRAAIVTPLRDDLAGKTQRSLQVLLAASGAILLIACVNLANLLMSRAEGRRREISVRAALGARRGRLVAQFLVESIMLAGAGAVAGLAIALPAMRFLETLVPDTMAATPLTLDWRVLLFSAAITIVAGIVFGLAPALGGTRLDLQQSLRDGGRGTAGGRSHRWQHGLIVAETALAVVLLTLGALLLQTFQHLRQLDLGIRSERLLTFVTPLFRYPEFDKRFVFVNAQLEKIRGIPGVVNAAAISRIPLTEIEQSTRYAFVGQPVEDTRAQIGLSRVVTRGYFATVGAQLREGRFFDASDQHSPTPVAVVNETFADRHFPGRSALGAQFKFGNHGASAYVYTVAGVVKEIRERGVAEQLKPVIYRVHEQADQTGDQPSGIVVRTAVPPTSIVPAVRQAIWSIDSSQTVTRVQTIDDIVDRQLSGASQTTTLLTAFALLALVLAAVGLYGVLSYAVAQRTHEIGVRMALGATTGNILFSFTRRGLVLALSGLAIGFLLAAWAARLMRTLFYDFQPDYIPAALTASFVLLSVSAIAACIPARRASRVDPMVALQRE